MIDQAAPRSIIVVGNGIVAHAAAIAFRRAVPTCAVTVVQPASPLSALDRIGAASGVMMRFHDQIGLDAARFMDLTGATVVTDQHWKCDGLSGIRCVRAADAISFHDGIALHQLWLAHQDTAEWPVISASQAANADFGIRFDAARYLALLADFTRHLGITTASVGDWQVEIEDDHSVAAIAAADGQRWTADFYIDASDSASPMMVALGAEWLDWSQHMPTLSLQDLVSQPLSTPADDISLDGSSAAWKSASSSVQFEITGGGPAPGRISMARRGNAIALGDAACRAQSFDGGALGLAMLDIMRAIALLPARSPSPREAAEYSRQAAIVHELHGDWAAARWLKVTGASQRALRPGLADMLTQFGERGRIPVRDMDPVTTGQWLGWLIALGIRPRRIDPTAWAIDPATARNFLKQAASRSPLSRS